MSDIVLIDTHVHLHRCYDLAASLDHAAANFRSASGNSNSGPLTGVLMLTEHEPVTRFPELAGLASRHEPVGRWRFEPTGEAESLMVRRDDGVVLVLIAGRQIVTREGLEVLALATTHAFADRQTLEQSVAAVQAAGALVVLPYGVGKWTGKRGQIVQRVFERDADELVLLGDNGNRLSIGPLPKLLARAMQQGHPVLPGSDPLPVPDQVRRIGAVGMMLPLRLDLHAPARQLKAALAGLTQPPQRFGTFTGLLRFVRLQVVMQLRKRRLI